MASENEMAVQTTVQEQFPEVKHVHTPVVAKSNHSFKQGMRHFENYSKKEVTKNTPRSYETFGRRLVTPNAK
jgi:hypothetical protein